MRMKPLIKFSLWLGLLSSFAAVSGNRLANARDQQISAQITLANHIKDAKSINDLRSKQQVVSERKRPEQDVIAKVNATLADVGIPSVHFDSLRPESDGVLPDSKYRRQSVRINLNELTVAELGAFLNQWSITQKLWTPARIELLHSRNKSNADRYNITILITATYLANG